MLYFLKQQKRIGSKSVEWKWKESVKKANDHEFYYQDPDQEVRSKRNKKRNLRLQLGLEENGHMTSSRKL